MVTEYGEEKLKLKDSITSTETIRGLKPIIIGCKINVHKGKGVVPDISFIPSLDIPALADDYFHSQSMIQRFRLCFANNITDKIAFSYNVAGEWENKTRSMSFIYTASLAFQLHNKVGMFIESYGFIKEYSLPDHRLDGGFTYLATDNLQFDISGGYGLSTTFSNAFVTSGVSWRLNAFCEKNINK